MVFPVIGGDGKPTGYNIENSLSFNDGDSPNVSNNPNAGSGSDGSRTQFSISMWVKKSRVSGTQQFLTSAVATNTFYGTIKFNGDNKIQVNLINSGSDQDEIVTTAVYRDVSAWYHLFFRFDKTQASLSDGIKLYVNNVLQTWGTTTYAQNQGYHFGKNGTPMTIGNYNAAEAYAALYFSEVYYVEGELKNSTDFGETNDNGVWIPKAYNGNFGDEGFFLEFKQTGTSQNASGIGADTSGNTNHFAVANLAATDVTTDTPTNNFATINALANYYNPATLSEGNTRVDFANDVSTSYVISTIGVASGKWYCEVKGVDIPSYGEIGIASRPRQDDGNDDKLTVNVNNYGYTANNGNVKSNGTAGSSYGNSYSDGDMIGIAMDLDNNKLYFSKNGTWQNSGDPTSGSTGTGAFSIAEATTTHDGFYYFAGGSNINNDNTRMDFNFGNPSFSISSGNADANGYGNFEYAVPSGYYALCTKNLAEYG